MSTDPLSSRGRRARALGLAAALVGCGGGAADGSAAALAAARGAVVVPWTTQPVAARAALAAADPLVQVVLVEELLLAHPADQPAICGALPPAGPAAERCARHEARPHLVGLVGGAAPRGVWPPAPGTRRDWAVVDGGCGADLRCAATERDAAAAAGEVDRARALCVAGWPAGTDRQECLFQAADGVIEAHGLARVRDAMDLCAEAGPLVGPCAAHVVDGVVPEGSAAGALAAAATLRQLFPAPAGDRYADLLWALWTWAQLEDAPRPTAAGHAALPPAAQPHLRQALAFAMLAEEPPEGLVLDERAAELRALIASEQPRARAPRHRTPVPPADAWPVLWPQPPASAAEAALPLRWVGHGGSRTEGESLEDDALIVILEAAARLPQPPPAAFFLAGLAPERAPRVRWTAARLLGVLAPAARPSAATEADPLVRGRLGP